MKYCHLTYNGSQSLVPVFALASTLRMKGQVK